MRRICPYRLLPFSHWFLWLCILFAVALLTFAVIATRHAATYPDYLLICRWIAAAKENAAAVLLVGALGSTLSDVILRQQLSRHE